MYKDRNYSVIESKILFTLPAVEHFMFEISSTAETFNQIECKKYFCMWLFAIGLAANSDITAKRFVRLPSSKYQSSMPFSFVFLLRECALYSR